METLPHKMPFHWVLKIEETIQLISQFGDNKVSEIKTTDVKASNILTINNNINQNTKHLIRSLK